MEECTKWIKHSKNLIKTGKKRAVKDRWKIVPPRGKASIINSLTRAWTSQCWSTINRGTDLLAFHSNPLPSIFAPLTREILNFLKMERPPQPRYLCTLRVGYATRSCCIINSNLLTSFQPNESTPIYIYPYHLYFLTKFTFLHRLDNWYIECCLPYHRYLSFICPRQNRLLNYTRKNNFILFHSIDRFMIIYHSIN